MGKPWAESVQTRSVSRLGPGEAAPGPHFRCAALLPWPMGSLFQVIPESKTANLILLESHAILLPKDAAKGVGWMLTWHLV